MTGVAGSLSSDCGCRIYFVTLSDDTDLAILLTCKSALECESVASARALAQELRIELVALFAAAQENG